MHRIVSFVFILLVAVFMNSCSTEPNVPGTNAAVAQPAANNGNAAPMPQTQPASRLDGKEIAAYTENLASEVAESKMQQFLRELRDELRRRTDAYRVPHADNRN